MAMFKSPALAGTCFGVHVGATRKSPTVTSLLQQKHQQFRTLTIATSSNPPPTTQSAAQNTKKNAESQQLLEKDTKQTFATLLRPLWPRLTDTSHCSPAPGSKSGHHGFHAYGSRPDRLERISSAEHIEESSSQRARVESQRRRLQLSPDKGPFLLSLAPAIEA